jgi:hypothetical protein
MLLLGLATAALGSTGEGSGQIIRFDFWGFSIAPDPQAPGDMLQVIGVVNESTTILPLELDFQNNEYTVYMYGLRLAQIVPSGPFITEYHYTGGVAEIYEDPSFNAPFRANTDPELVPELDPTEVPAHFIDGQLLVRFMYRAYISLWYDFAGLGSIAYTATEMRAVGGSALPELHAMHMTVGWHTGGGFTNDEGSYIPDGYGMRYDPQYRWENPLPVEPSTWGNIKASFR